jgi:hypothetical protein
MSQSQLKLIDIQEIVRNVNENKKYDIDATILTEIVSYLCEKLTTTTLSGGNVDKVREENNVCQ